MTVKVIYQLGIDKVEELSMPLRKGQILFENYDSSESLTENCKWYIGKKVLRDVKRRNEIKIIKVSL